MLRKFLQGLSFVFVVLIIAITYAKESKPTILQVIEKTITVNGKDSKVFGIVQPNGKFGYEGVEGQLFHVIVENKTNYPLVLHWHGIIDPNPDDGVPYVTQLPIQPGKNYHYQFKLKQAGTYWLHSHYKLQEQQLMAAPLIIHETKPAQEKDVIMFIQDFTFRDPKIIYEELRGIIQDQHQKKLTTQLSETHESMPMKMNGKESTQNDSSKSEARKMTPDVSDVKFDAYLTNHKTLQNPDVIRVKPNEKIRLRIINASASSNYYIDLGKLSGTLIAVDGAKIKPVQGTQFQIAIGNRLDVIVQIPEGEGAFPILALPEGTHQQTGLILATENASIPTLSEKTETTNPLLNDSQDLQLTPEKPFAEKPVKQSLFYKLAGDMKSYRWTMNGQEWPDITPYKVKPHQRVEMIFDNKSSMSHPMHFHGHVFQITEINGKKINGRKGDTINVMPNSTVKVIFDTDNPGIWMLHCHVLYHQQGGMMTTVNYEDYPNKFTRAERMQGASLYESTLD